MVALLDRLESWASVRNIVLVVIVVTLCGAVLFPRAYGELERLSGYTEPLDMRTGFSPDDAHEVLRAYGPEGRAVYVRTALTVDTVFPVANALLLAFVAVRLLRAAFPESPGARAAALIPGLLVVADLTENLCIVALAVRFPDRLPLLARVGSGAGVAKWIAVGASMLVVVLALLAFVVRSRGRGRGETGEASSD